MKWQEELLMTDLCSRIPYGVRVKFTEFSSLKDKELMGVNVYNNDMTIVTCRTENGTITMPLKYVKPYLFPLSSMTEEQIEKLKEELCNMYDPYHDYDSYENWGVEVFEKHIHSDNYKFTFTSDVVDWLNKNHFDYRGLISVGLAVDATNLNIY